ncbi:unnamed protein product [Caretta caretta]
MHPRTGFERPGLQSASGLFPDPVGIAAGGIQRLGQVLQTGYRAPLDNSGPTFPKPLARAMSQKQVNDPGKDLTTPLCHYDHANFFNENLADESDRG